MTTTLQKHDADLSGYIRDLTQDEIDRFRRDGVVIARGFVHPDLARECLRHWMAWGGLEFDEWPENPDEQARCVEQIAKLQVRDAQYLCRRADPWMANYLSQRQFGKAAAQLMSALGAHIKGVKLYSDALHFKAPIDSGKSVPLLWHQDMPYMPFDRTEAVQTWTALSAITPDMGPMSHLVGSHAERCHGMHYDAGETAEEAYPEIFERYEKSAPQAYEPGDTVFHDCLTYHSSGQNTTNRFRWAMSSYRFSDRCIYTGVWSPHANDQGLAIYKHFDHPNFPTVYP